jgi:hypothetical protein
MTPYSRIARAVPILRGEVAAADDLHAQDDDGLLALLGRERVRTGRAAGGDDLGGQACCGLERAAAKPEGLAWGGDHRGRGGRGGRSSEVVREGSGEEEGPDGFEGEEGLVGWRRQLGAGRR